MTGITALLIAAGGILLTSFSPVRAESLACQTVNGETVCMRGSGTLICETINDLTRCRSEPARPLDQEIPLPPLPFLVNPSDDIVIEQNGTRLRVGAGGVEVHID